MNMRVFIILALALCAYADETEKENTESAQPDKRQTQEGHAAQYYYRSAKNHEQVAPVMEHQEDERGLGNRTSLQPISEDQSAKRERPARDDSSKRDDAPEPSNEQNKIDQPAGQGNDISNGQPSLVPNLSQVDIQNNGFNLAQQQQNIPPPRDGKSYTPEEFTSLIVSGYAITPVPDFGDYSGSRPYLGSLSTPRSPLPIAPTPYPASQFTPNPYFSQQSPVSSTLAPNLLGIKEQPQLDQDNLQLNLEQYKASQSLPRPKNNKAYTLEEFNGLIAAGYPVTPVPVSPFNLDVSQSRRQEAEEYRPGQVFSLNPRELLELQPERKAPIGNSQLLQQLYSNPQQEQKQNLQPIYFFDPQSQSGRQVPPSHAVIARPNFSFNGGEASVGAALSVSDTGANSEDSFNQELLSLLGQAGIRSQEPRPTQATTNVQSVAPQYQQVDRYISKPSKKSSKIRSKVHSSPPQPSAAPQQYLIETTNVQQQQQQQQQQYQQQQQLQYRPTPQPQRLAQSLRYVPISQPIQQQQDQFLYERPESQGLKIVPAPKLQQQQPRAQYNYRLAPQFQQQEAAPKQYRIIELPRAQPIRQELRIPASSVEKPTYLKRYPEIEKQRSVKIYDPIGADASAQQNPLFGEQFVLRPVYRNQEQRPRYELAASFKSEQSRAADSTKTPHSAIYVSKNLPRPQKVRPQSALREQSYKIEQPSSIEQVNIEQHGQSLEEQRAQLPPPKNNKAYTPEEFAALVEAGYSVTPVPVSASNLDIAQSRSSLEAVTAQPKRRLTQRRRNQYLPVRDDAP